MGCQYWQQLAEEHGLESDGTPRDYPGAGNLQFRSGNDNNQNTYDRDDRPELFFTLSDHAKYTPRAVLVDLEPLVVNKCMNQLPMINPRNVHLSEQGLGAANNWSNGYQYGTNHQDELINLIDREVDKCDNLSNFQLVHSVAGGTGAGVGSLIMELLNDRYGLKKMINTFSIFPLNEKTSDVVVQPYNTVLTLKRLIDFSDTTLVFHNDAINLIENVLFNNRTPNEMLLLFEGANKLILMVCALVLNPLRFPNYMNSLYELIFSTIVPSPDLKFLLSLIAPFATLKHAYVNEYDMILELFNDRYKMNRAVEPIKYILVMNYLIGDNLNQQDIRKGLSKAAQRVEFVPWSPLAIQMVNGRRSPYLAEKGTQKQLMGIQISNNTLMISVFTKILKQYDLLAKREAYINSYYQSNDKEERLRVKDMFNECKETVLLVVEEYKACQVDSFLDDDILDEMS